MKRVIYTSFARKGLELSDCAAILKGAVANNAKSGITGVLLLADQTFLQYLEGPARAIDDTLGVIRRDRRHSHLALLVDEARAPAQRLFQQWQMGFYHLSAAEPALGGGVLRNEDAGVFLALRSAAADDLCARLLHSFFHCNAAAMRSEVRT